MKPFELGILLGSFSNCSVSSIELFRFSLFVCQISCYSFKNNFVFHQNFHVYWHLVFCFFFKLYIIVLVLPNIKMNPPQVYMCSPSWTLLPPHTIPLGRPSVLAPSIQYRVSNLDWQLISYMIFYMFQCHSPKSSHSLPLPQSPKDCSIHQCHFCCLVHRVIVTIFLNSIYMR